jgi:hypothetical protein
LKYNAVTRRLVIVQKIRCVVERITCQNPENGYSVLQFRERTTVNWKERLEGYRYAVIRIEKIKSKNV